MQKRKAIRIADILDKAADEMLARPKHETTENWTCPWVAIVGVPTRSGYDHDDALRLFAEDVYGEKVESTSRIWFWFDPLAEKLGWRPAARLAVRKMRALARRLRKGALANAA